MGILPTRAAPSKAARPHDPDVCGLGYDSDCDACRASAERAEGEFCERDADAKERACLRKIDDRFTEATGITLDELAYALQTKLAESMAKIACVVTDEREAAA